MDRLISIFGYALMLFLAYALSSDWKRFPWRIVATGSLLQFLFALLMITTPQGRWFFQHIGDFFTGLLDCVDAGSGFVFGGNFENNFFAFKILPTIIFFSALMSILYYLRIMQTVVAAVAWVMQRTMGLSGAESLSAAANIFVGQTEAPLVIKPYVGAMTRSELMTVMVGGFATIAGGVLAAFVGMGLDAGHLLTASIISAPAGIMIAKILEPEKETPKTMGAVKILAPPQGENVIEAAAIGAADGLKLALNVAAMLIAFLALIAMFDLFLGWMGNWFEQKWSLGAFLGWLFWPIAWSMGIPYDDCSRGGELLGLKMVANEFVAYEKLASWKSGADGTLHPRTVVIMSYALCGFSNFGSIGIQIGGIGALAPERKGDLAKLGLRAMLGGTLACCLTGCVAGLLIGDNPPTLETPTAAEEKGADTEINTEDSQPETQGHEVAEPKLPEEATGGGFGVDQQDQQGVGSELRKDLQTSPAGEDASSAGNSDPVEAPKPSADGGEDG